MSFSRAALFLATAGWLVALAVPVLGHDEETGADAARIEGRAVDAAWADPAARARAVAAGAPLFVRHCASCHGTGGQGVAASHTPDLTDDHWLFGGDDIDTFLINASDIAFTIRHGIRSDDPHTAQSGADARARHRAQPRSR